MAQSELEIALARFIWTFEQVFQEDWPYSRAALRGTGFISEEGTFLEPKIANEFDDWGYRGLLLRTYRELKAAMERSGVRPESPFPAADQH